MAITIGTVSKPGYIIVKPSTADEIEIGGVINPSAIKDAQPINAGIIVHFALYLLTNAYNAKIPPSPLLSAFKARITYFIVTIKVNVQNTQLTPPSTNASDTCSCAIPKIAFNT